MYKIIATDDFINVMKDVSINYLSVLSSSFISISKIEDVKSDGTFISDLLEQIKNQEVE